MIVFDLECRTGGHRFEGWFSSSDDYARQQERGLVSCPECGMAEVIKAPMAPAVARKGNQQVAQPRAAPPANSEADSPDAGVVSPVAVSPVAVSNDAMPPEAARMMMALAKMQARALEKSRWVGENFAEASRAMHYGEREAEPIHGQATLEEARDLIEEGVAVAPLPFPVAPPGEAN